MRHTIGDLKHLAYKHMGTRGAPKGHRFAAKENMSAESHKLRMQGLYRAWAKRKRKDLGERIVSTKMKLRRRARYRMRLKVTAAKEMREIQEIARQNAVAAMNRLAHIINDPDSQDSSAIAASQVMLDRAYGRPNQPNTNLNVDANGKAPDVTQKELDKRIEQALTRIESITGRKTKTPKGEKRPPDVLECDRDPDGSTVH